MKRIATIAAECLVDLGVTVVYATLVGLAIAAVTVSDGGLPSLLPAIGYAALLPLAVLVLIIIDAALRAFEENRAARREQVADAGPFSSAMKRVLR